MLLQVLFFLSETFLDCLQIMPIGLHQRMTDDIATVMTISRM